MVLQQLLQHSNFIEILSPASMTAVLAMAAAFPASPLSAPPLPLTATAA